MSFLFATSHLPAFKRPQNEEEEDNAQPMQRSGGVRAISHLEEPGRGNPAGALSQRGAQAMGRNVQGVKPTGPRTLPADGVAAAKASGIFDVVRHQYNQGGNEHFMDEDGQLQPRNESRSQTSPSPRAERPSWADESEVHADHEPDGDADDDHCPHVTEDTTSWHAPGSLTAGVVPHDHESDPAADGSAPRVWGLRQAPAPAILGRKPMQWHADHDPDPGFDDIHQEELGPHTRDAGFAPSPQDMRRALRNGSDDSIGSVNAGYRDPATGQPRGLSSILGATFQSAALKSRLGAAQQTPMQSADIVQQNPGAGATPIASGANAEGSALQEHRRVRLLDETIPAKAPEKPEKPNKPRQTNRSQKDDRIIKTPKDQFKAEMAAYERELAAHPEKMAAYEREKAAYEKALTTAAANKETNKQNRQTLKAWENYDRAIEMLKNAPEGRKVLDHLRDNTTRVFKVIMVNDPDKDSYMGIKIKPGARGQYVNTGMKDEQGRDVHVIFLSAPALARDAVTTGGKLNPDAEALEDVWHEFYHASERQDGNAIDPLGVGTSHINDRVDPKQWPNAHEKRAVRFENIIRKRNGGRRIKTKYGGGYILDKDNNRIEIPAIDVNDPVPTFAPLL